MFKKIQYNVLSSQKLIFIFLLFLCSGYLFAQTNISTGTLLLYTDFDPEETTILVQDSDKNQLPLQSGLQFFAGDRLETNNDAVIILVPQKNLVLKVQPSSIILFDSIELRNNDFAIQLTLVDGSLDSYIYSKEELLQALGPAIVPTTPIRPDSRTDKSERAREVFVHIISDKTGIRTEDVDGSEGVFISQSGLSVEKLVEAYRKAKAGTELNARYLLVPSYSYEPKLITRMLMGLYTPLAPATQNVESTFYFNLNYKKFKLRVRAPVLFTNGNFVYNPFGENDYTSVFRLDEPAIQTQVFGSQKAGLRIEHLLASVLAKISTFSIGTPTDSFYFYYGDQRHWGKTKNSLLAYEFQPTPNFANNVNKDLVFSLNLINFGNVSRIRHFQAPSIIDSWLSRFELFSNRFWIKPSASSYPFEIGITTAFDFHTNKFSTKNTFLTNTNSQYYFFYGIDVLFPLAQNFKFKSDITLEFAQLLPGNSIGFIFGDQFSNFGGKLGFNFDFFFSRSDFSFGFAFNTYVTRGFFQPHLWTAGYEYSTRPRINQAIFELNQNTASLKSRVFTASPELIYTMKAGDVAQLNVGALFPISLNVGYSTFDLYQAPSIFVDLKLRFVTIGNIFQLSYNLYFSNNYLNYQDWANPILALNSLSDIFLGENAVLDTYLRFAFLENYVVDAGLRLQPQYIKSELQYSSAGDEVLKTLVPYITFSFRLFELE